jgi:hypothetical protein
VAGHHPPALDAEEVRAAIVEQDRDAPDRALQRPVGERRADQQADADRGRHRERDHRRAQVRVVAAPDREQHEMRDPDAGVGEREQQRRIVERLGHAQRGDEERRHRPEHRDPHHALLGVDEARQPRVAAPGPPQHREHEHRLGEPVPGRLVGHQLRALGEREHEDEVEEQLERGHALLVT